MTANITPAEAWAPPSEVVTLPSGKTARLRKEFPTRRLIRSGQITMDELDKLEDAANGNLSQENAQIALGLIGLVCEAMFLEPRVTADGADGTVCADDLADEDQDYVLECAFGGTPSEAFPGEPVRAEGGDDSKVLGKPAKRAARPAKRKPQRPKP